MTFVEGEFDCLNGNPYTSATRGNKMFYDEYDYECAELAIQLNINMDGYALMLCWTELVGIEAKTGKLLLVACDENIHGTPQFQRFDMNFNTVGNAYHHRTLIMPLPLHAKGTAPCQSHSRYAFKMRLDESREYFLPRTLICFVSAIPIGHHSINSLMAMQEKTDFAEGGWRAIGHASAAFVVFAGGYPPQHNAIPLPWHTSTKDNKYIMTEVANHARMEVRSTDGRGYCKIEVATVSRGIFYDDIRSTINPTPKSVRMECTIVPTGYRRSWQQQWSRDVLASMETPDDVLRRERIRAPYINNYRKGTGHDRTMLADYILDIVEAFEYANVSYPDGRQIPLFRLVRPRMETPVRGEGRVKRFVEAVEFVGNGASDSMQGIQYTDSSTTIDFAKFGTTSLQRMLSISGYSLVWAGMYDEDIAHMQPHVLTWLYNKQAKTAEAMAATLKVKAIYDEVFVRKDNET